MLRCMLFCVPASQDSEAERTKFLEHKKKLEVELDRQHLTREKLELELAANGDLCGSLRLGMSTLLSHYVHPETCVVHLDWV